MNLLKTVSMLLLLSCDPSVQGYTSEGTLYRGQTYAERLDNALAGVSSEQISFDASEGLSHHLGEDGKLYADVPGKIKGIAAETEIETLLADAAVREALLGTDEAAAADLLREAGARVLILHSDVTASLDRNAQVLSRLYRHDHLEHFSLFRVGDGLLYYTVRAQPALFPPQLAAACMQYLRQRMAGQPPAAFPDVKSPDGSWTFAATLRGQGQALVTSFASNAKLQGALEELVRDLERDHRRNVELLGFPRLSEHIKDGLTLELHYVYERAYLEPRDEDVLQDYFEMGIDGAFILREFTESDGSTRIERGTLPGAASYTRSIRSADAFLRQTAEMGGMSERRPWRAEDSWLESFRSIHYRLDENNRLIYLFRGVPAVPMSAVTLASVRDGIIAAGEWYLANLKPNGQVTYKFWPAENRYSNEYNFVRHTLSTWNLVQSWELDPRPEFLDGAKAALAYTNAHLVREDVQTACDAVAWCERDRLDVEGQMAFYSYNNNQKLGSVVVNLLGMIDLARATGSTEWDEQLIEMGRFVKFMQKSDGTFQGYYVDPDHDYYTFVNDIVPGEAALSLVYLAEYFDDDSWINSLPTYWEHYKPWFAEREAKKDETAPWPMSLYHNDTRLELVQFGPWTVMAANAYHRRTGDAEVAKFGLQIARWMIDAYMWTEDRAPFPDYVGGYYKLPGELPAMQAFCYAEGIAAAYQLALRATPDQATYFGDATAQTMRFALQMQYNQFNVYPFSRPEEAMGGIRYAMNETKVRIDYVYHAQSSMYQWLKAAESDPNLSEEVRSGPPMEGQLRDKPVPEPEAVLVEGSAE